MNGVTVTRAEPATLSAHWQEYAIEGALLGLFMVSACLFTVLLYHPASPIPALVPNSLLRRCVMGLAMGGTAMSLVYSAWGQQSGAHINPAVTLTFARLGRVAPRDAAAYVFAQFVGGVLGVLLARVIAGELLADRAVSYAVTVPGAQGPWVAFAAEVGISFVLMTVVLAVAGHPRYGRWTGVCAGLLVATFIAIEAPLSGMSMNPARTLGSAVGAQRWTALWLYFLAPPLGMLAAAQLHLVLRGPRPQDCAKFHHANGRRCIHCAYRAARAA
jgi:aquaporin Z